jgi:predicted MPP superfamily phosphohydrolase
VAVTVHAFNESRRTPVIRRDTIALADWPKDAKPITALLVSDIHIGNSSMDQGRLGRIVDQIDALHPDIILIAGDFIYGEDPHGAEKASAALKAELSRLRAPLGTIATLGNHDIWTGRAILVSTLEQAGITVLQNQAVQRGPLAIGGIGDVYTRQDKVPETYSWLDQLKGARVVVTHSPAIMWKLPAYAGLVLTGHTHCGQINLPFATTITPIGHIPYWCGLFREPTRTVVVTAGVGTSNVPLRLRSPPDMWLLTVGPKKG